MKNVTSILLLPLALLLAGCPRPQLDDPPMRATFAIMQEVPPGAPLEELLVTLEELLRSALYGRMEGAALADFRRAEALSDRLLEARMPFEWIPGEQYRLGSRLRQLQSTADRVLAMQETGRPRDSVVAELQLLYDQVRRAQAIVAAGGTVAPPDIHQLLRAADPAGAGTRRGFQQQQRQPQPPQPQPPQPQQQPQPPQPPPVPVGTPVPPGGG
jgi:hypothetical protein